MRICGEAVQDENLRKGLQHLLLFDEPDPGEFAVVERSGALAFDLLAQMLDTLDDQQRARALYVLLTMTRQFAVDRLPDAIRIALRHVDSGDLGVRSAAVSVAARGSLVLPAFTQLRGAARPSAPAVGEAIARATALGIDERAAAEAARFFERARGDLTP